MAVSDRFDGKVAVVTGAADGMGLEIAKQFLERGATVVAADLSEEGLHAVHKAESANLRLVVGDVTAEGAPKRLIDDTVSALGRLDILVNSAGIYEYSLLEAMSMQSWKRTLDVNLTSVFALCQRAIPYLRKAGGGRIINIASTGAERSEAGSGAYVASKHAVAGLTKTLAIELGLENITVNYVCPGPILTGMTRAHMEDSEARAAMEAMGAMGRIGLPSEVAHAVMFLASEGASYVTGHGLAVDGGLLAKL